ncbi:MAG: hypothetical protein HN509_02265 [Halobacteriovoraceae bacterium]|jgi:nucleoside phosphorylase|nr:hypothetical protein [Halobacteriovoraceae bacterium]MBT5095727.1 hypothetical protein [Halobacteriovoraceae bacterium]
MDLLVFAHANEAQHFLKEGGYKSMPFHFAGLYRNEQNMLLLCGEGIGVAREKMAATLAVHSGEISRVVNLGVCGSLSSQAELETVYSIRTVYGQDCFKSFSSHLGDSRWDLISVRERVLKDSQASELENFAPLIDREAWGIAAACELFKIPFSCLKVVSDRPGETDGVCQKVIEKAPLYSKLLFEAYAEQAPLVINDPQSSLTLSALFYATTSQKNRLKALQSSLELKFPIEAERLESLDLPQLEQLELTPKQRTSLLIERIGDLLNPFQKDIRQQLAELPKPFEKAGFSLKFDGQLESKKMHLNGTICDQRQVVQLIAALKELPYQKIENIFNGKLDV